MVKTTLFKKTEFKPKRKKTNTDIAKIGFLEKIGKTNYGQDTVRKQLHQKFWGDNGYLRQIEVDDDSFQCIRLQQYSQDKHHTLHNQDQAFLKALCDLAPDYFIRDHSSSRGSNSTGGATNGSNANNPSLESDTTGSSSSGGQQSPQEPAQVPNSDDQLTRDQVQTLLKLFFSKAPDSEHDVAYAFCFKFIQGKGNSSVDYNPNLSDGGTPNYQNEVGIKNEAKQWLEEVAKKANENQNALETLELPERVHETAAQPSAYGASSDGESTNYGSAITPDDGNTTAGAGAATETEEQKNQRLAEQLKDFYEHKLPRTATETVNVTQDQWRQLLSNNQWKTTYLKLKEHTYGGDHEKINQ